MDPKRLLILLGWVAVGAVMTGCGEQDLYEPPNSPFDKAGQVELLSEAEDVAVLGNYAYMAAGEGGLQVVDISDPFHPELVLWEPTERYAYAIHAIRTEYPDGTIRDIAYVVEGTEGFTSYDLTAVPDSIHNYHQGATGVYAYDLCLAPPTEYVDDPHMLVVAESWKGLRIFYSSVEQPGAADQGPWVATPGYAKNVDLAGDYAYVADGEMGVTVVDLSNIRTGGLKVIFTLDTPGDALDIEVAGGHVFVADDDHGMQVMEILEDQSLELISSLALGGDCRAIEVSEGVAFLAAEDAGLHVVDVRDPYHPTHLGSVSTSYAQGISLGENNLVCVADRDDGLVVFLGPELPDDPVPPGTVSDLSTYLLSTESLELSWTAPGDDGHEGTAREYDVRWSTDPVSDATWDASQRVGHRPVPKEAGTRQSTKAENLTPGDTLYFALRAADKSGNWSEHSNVVRALMTAPTLSDGGVEPDTGSAHTVFEFTVTYQDAENDSPVVHNIIIDDSTFEMTKLEDGSSFDEGVTYRHESTLDVGSHDHFFEFDDGNGPRVTTDVAFFPQVPPPLDVAMIRIDISGGVDFAMGSAPDEPGREEDETQHPVTLTRGFELSETEVNQYLYWSVTGKSPSEIPGVSRPVEHVGWYDAVIFCNQLSAWEGLTRAYDISGVQYDPQGRISSAQVSWNRDADGYRLPTEAEWEYACRAGSTDPLANGELTFPSGCDSLDVLLDEVGWYCANADIGAGPKTQDVGGKVPNAFGLYDMHGNVWEWCWDVYGEYPTGSVTDPIGPAGFPGDKHVCRGGSWFYFARECRSASRLDYYPASRDATVGFRIARNGE